MEQRPLGPTEPPIAPPSQPCANCADLHPIVYDIVSELSAFEDVQFQPRHTHDIMQNGLSHALRWVLNAVRNYSSTIRDLSRRPQNVLADIQVPRSSLPPREPRELGSSASEYEKRRAEDYGDESHRSSKRARDVSSFELASSSTLAAGVEAERRRSHQSTTAPSSSHSPPRAGSSPGSGILPPPSPVMAPFNVRTLPSPASLNFPNVPTLPPISSPAASYPSSAHAAHLQDLQHQISTKTLAYQTLLREYDALLQKLERQRTKCATLEKKFEVSDTEINNLTDDKERLQDKVGALETEVEDLKKTREDERKEYGANGDQYRKILEMASRLQEQGAMEKRKWVSEKKELEDKIETLEGFGKGSRESSETNLMTAVEQHVSASGTSDAPDTAGPAATAQQTTIPEQPELPLMSIASPQPADSSLRPELTRLNQRVRYLEAALSAVGTSARTLMDLGQSVFDKTETALSLGAKVPSPDPPDPRERRAVPSPTAPASMALGSRPSSAPATI
ncbi:MAG: hypothetical protein M1821_004672 [Bathelium mastoideum]|nr:MAG: hypothetical protein M1821_004672 [Bathelium mastoideum]